MYLDKLELQNFRNLDQQSLSFDKGINIFWGSNGHGKTNLLEAIYLISLTKSFKTNKVDHIINYDEDYFDIKAKLNKSDYFYQINFFYDKNKKMITINGNSLSKFKDVIGLMNAVLFVPDDLLLLKGNPSIRRKLMDIELSKVYSKYFISLSNYNQLLKQRNLYLKQDEIDLKMIETINEQMVEYGLVISQYRNNFLDRIIEQAAEYYRKISGSDKLLTYEYTTNIKNDNEYLELLNKSYERDLILKKTTIGVHRDDFSIMLDNKVAGQFASQGEMRSIILALKLAIVQYIYEEINEYPILLLDDVLSELDDDRQVNLLEFLNDNVQTFVSTTSLSGLNNKIKKQAKIFKVNKGLVREDD